MTKSENKNYVFNNITISEKMIVGYIEKYARHGMKKTRDEAIAWLVADGQRRADKNAKARAKKQKKFQEIIGDASPTVEMMDYARRVMREEKSEKKALKILKIISASK